MGRLGGVGKLGGCGVTFSAIFGASCTTTLGKGSCGVTFSAILGASFTAACTLAAARFTGRGASSFGAGAAGLGAGFGAACTSQTHQKAAHTRSVHQAPSAIRCRDCARYNAPTFSQ